MADKSVTVTDPTIQAFTTIQLEVDKTGGNAHRVIVNYPSDPPAVVLVSTDFTAPERTAILDSLTAIRRAFKAVKGGY